MINETIQNLDSVQYTDSGLFKRVNLFICLAVVGMVFSLFHFNVLEKVELFTLDLRYKIRGQRPSSGNIIHIDIDESSIHNVGRWPWSREWHASLITALSEHKVKTIAFDVFFSDPSPLIDFFLVEATRLAGNVVYATAFEFGQRQARSQKEEQLLERFKLDETRIFGNKNNIPKLSTMVPILPSLYESAKTAGHVVTVPDPDGSIRRAPTVIAYGNNYYLHFAVEAALDYLGIDKKNVKVFLGKHIDLGDGTKIPIDNAGNILINWVAKWGKEFKHYSFWEVVVSYQQILRGEPPLIPLDGLKDKICLIGLTAIGLIDIKPIPIQPAYPIVGMHASIIDSILQRKFIRKVSPPMDLLTTLLLSLLIGIFVPKFKPLGGASMGLAIMLAYSIFAYLLFGLFGLWINMIYPLTGVLLSYITITIHAEIASALEKTRLFNLAVEDGLTKLYVVRHFKDILSREMAKAQRFNKPLSIILSDIDHFKQVNDNYGHLAGDFILRETANIFKNSCREYDIAGRYGGEEFILLLPETAREGAIDFAERLRKTLEGLTLEYNNIKFNITVSFGVAQFKNETTVPDFIKRADEALYVAKETGRNKVCFS